jgi:hypothetical protein
MTKKYRYTCINVLDDKGGEQNITLGTPYNYLQALGVVGGIETEYSDGLCSVSSTSSKNLKYIFNDSNSLCGLMFLPERGSDECVPFTLIDKDADNKASKNAEMFATKYCDNIVNLKDYSERNNLGIIYGFMAYNKKMKIHTDDVIVQYTSIAQQSNDTILILEEREVTHIPLIYNMIDKNSTKSVNLTDIMWEDEED